MKRFAAALGLLAALLAPGSAMAFHHGGIPARFCAADAAGSPSNDNGQAKEHLLLHHTLPLPPAGVAGQSGHTPQTGQIGEGADNCANS